MPPFKEAFTSGPPKNPMDPFPVRGLFSVARHHSRLISDVVQRVPLRTVQSSKNRVHHVRGGVVGVAADRRPEVGISVGVECEA